MRGFHLAIWLVLLIMSWTGLADALTPSRTMELTGSQLNIGSRKPGEKFKDCLACPEMVIVPSGSFRMGDLLGWGFRDEKPVHLVRIPRAFAVGKFEVTFSGWDACVEAGGCSHRPPDSGWGRGSRPVINVNWNDVQEFVRWLRRKTGKRYRLLSESEWEYVARAGATTRWSCGNNENCLWDHTWFGGNSRNRSQPVGVKSANKFGLHDLHGNLWEWVEDCVHESYAGAPSNGSAWTSGGNCRRRVLRGGSWIDIPRFLRAAYRYEGPTGERSYFSGFRVARALD